MANLKDKLEIGGAIVGIISVTWGVIWAIRTFVWTKKIAEKTEEKYILKELNKLEVKVTVIETKLIEKQDIFEEKIAKKVDERHTKCLNDHIEENKRVEKVAAETYEGFYKVIVEPVEHKLDNVSNNVDIISSDITFLKDSFKEVMENFKENTKAVFDLSMRFLNLGNAIADSAEKSRIATDNLEKTNSKLLVTNDNAKDEIRKLRQSIDEAMKKTNNNEKEVQTIKQKLNIV